MKPSNPDSAAPSEATPATLLPDSGITDLAAEIRLMRKVLAFLAEDIPANYRAMTTVFSAIVRGVHVQARDLGAKDENERDWAAEADAMLHILENRTDEEWASS